MVSTVFLRNMLACPSRGALSAALGSCTVSTMVLRNMLACPSRGALSAALGSWARRPGAILALRNLPDAHHSSMDGAGYAIHQLHVELRQGERWIDACVTDITLRRGVH